MSNIKKATNIMKNLSKNSKYQTKLGVYQRKKIEELLNLM